MGDENSNTVPLLLAAMGVISVDELIEYKKKEKPNRRETDVGVSIGQNKDQKKISTNSHTDGH